MCESCKNTCHKDHKIKEVGTLEFICQCQFTMKNCQLATQCLIKYTGKTSQKMA